MKVFTDTLSLQSTDSLTRKIFHENSFFFDIETTGFSARHCTVYLVGCASRVDDTVTVTQFFAETPAHEPEVLSAFADYVASHTCAITFNGLGFDVPFIEERCRQLGIPSFLTALKHTDIFKQISPLKKLFRLPSMKQKSIEQFLSISRDDLYSGGELINVYHDYCHDPSPDKLALMALHNKEDVLGMIEILPILSYPEFFRGNFSITDLTLTTYQEYEGCSSLELYFTLRPDSPLPKRISRGREDIYFSASGDMARLKAKVYQGELKYFYSNYKDYYYLPKEDMAIHKSVAFYVDKDFRTRAKAATCYSKKSGRFLPQYKDTFSPYFKLEYHDRISYIEMTDEFMESVEFQKSYVLHLLDMLL